VVPIRFRVSGFPSSLVSDPHPAQFTVTLPFIAACSRNARFAARFAIRSSAPKDSRLLGCDRKEVCGCALTVSRGNRWESRIPISHYLVIPHIPRETSREMLAESDGPERGSRYRVALSKKPRKPTQPCVIKAFSLKMENLRRRVSSSSNCVGDHIYMIQHGSISGIIRLENHLRGVT